MAMEGNIFTIGQLLHALLILLHGIGRPLMQDFFLSKLHHFEFFALILVHEQLILPVAMVSRSG